MTAVTMTAMTTDRRAALPRAATLRQAALWGALLLQAACALFFVYALLGPQLGLRDRPLDWAVLEAIELGAALGLVVGTLTTSVALHRARTRVAAVEDQLRVASGAFHDLLEERMTQWGLTPAEREVALFAIKGLTTAEIAGLRSTSEGTVKAQTAAVYRKAGVSSRPQLLSLFIDDLLGDGLPGAPPRRAAS